MSVTIRASTRPPPVPGDRRRHHVLAVPAPWQMHPGDRLASLHGRKVLGAAKRPRAPAVTLHRQKNATSPTARARVIGGFVRSCSAKPHRPCSAAQSFAPAPPSTVRRRPGRATARRTSGNVRAFPDSTTSRERRVVACLQGSTARRQARIDVCHRSRRIRHSQAFASDSLRNMRNWLSLAVTQLPAVCEVPAPEVCPRSAGM